MDAAIANSIFGTKSDHVSDANAVDNGRTDEMAADAEQLTLQKQTIGSTAALVGCLVCLALGALGGWFRYVYLKKGDLRLWKHK